MATINTTMAAGSTASPYYLNVRIQKQLCTKTSQTPVFTPVLSLVSYTLVGTGQYQAVVNVQGIVNYTPCGSCCGRTQSVNENFVVPFASATAPSAVTVEAGTATNTLVTNGCCKCSNQIVSNVPLTLTVTTT